MRLIRYLLTIVALCCSSTLSAAPEMPQPFAPDTFDSLDTGIYWFGKNMRSVKALPNQDNPYYNSNAPTVIYVHGWSMGENKKHYREVFSYGFVGGPDEYLADAWINNGWNVGIFYWNQLSDEIMPYASEAKIWSSNTAYGMRWKDGNGDFHYDGSTLSASDLLFDAYLSAMTGYNGSHIRLVGHSFGNQMVINLAKRVADGTDNGSIAEKLLPKRIAILDAAYMGGQRGFLNWRTTYGIALEYIEQLVDRGVLFESYRTSALMAFAPITFMPKPLTRLMAHAELKPLYFLPWDFQKKHIASIWHYFWSFQFAPPKLILSRKPGLAASTPDWRVKELMNPHLQLIQVTKHFQKSPANKKMILWPKQKKSSQRSTHL